MSPSKLTTPTWRRWLRIYTVAICLNVGLGLWSVATLWVNAGLAFLGFAIINLGVLVMLWPDDANAGFQARNAWSNVAPPLDPEAVREAAQGGGFYDPENPPGVPPEPNTTDPRSPVEPPSARFPAAKEIHEDTPVPVFENAEHPWEAGNSGKRPRPEGWDETPRVGLRDSHSWGMHRDIHEESESDG